MHPILGYKIVTTKLPLKNHCLEFLVANAGKLTDRFMENHGIRREAVRIKPQNDNFQLYANLVGKSIGDWSCKV